MLARIASVKKVYWHLRDAWFAFVELFQRKEQLAADEQWDVWRKDIERIYKETVYVFENRYVFRRLVEIMKGHPKVEAEGGFFYGWILGMYGRDMVLAVGREADRNTEVVNLIQLMYQMIQRPDVITRERRNRKLKINPGDASAWPPGDDAVIYEMTEMWFTEHVGAGPQLDPALIKKDRNWLEKRCGKVMTYRHKVVAHRSSMELTLTVKDLDGALNAIEVLLKKYYVLFTGASLVGAEPSVLIPWEKIFRYAWLRPNVE